MKLAALALTVISCSTGPEKPYDAELFSSCAHRYDAFVDMRDGIESPPAGALSESLAACARRAKAAERMLIVCSVRLKDYEEAEHER